MNGRLGIFEIKLRNVHRTLSHLFKNSAIMFCMRLEADETYGFFNRPPDDCATLLRRWDDAGRTKLSREMISDMLKSRATESRTVVDMRA
jgi:hypothetical protein